MKINVESIPYAAKENFLSNCKNKAELISKLTEEFENANIRTVLCRDDADTTIISECLQQSQHGNVEVRAEDADILIMLVHHYEMK